MKWTCVHIVLCCRLYNNNYYWFYYSVNEYFYSHVTGDKPALGMFVYSYMYVCFVLLHKIYIRVHTAIYTSMCIREFTGHVYKTNVFLMPFKCCMWHVPRKYT